jgi:hypothetical protein
VSTQPTSTEVRLAAVLTAVAAGFGVLVMLGGAALFAANDMLLFVLPLIGTVIFTAGLFLALSAVGLAVALWRCKRGVRLQTVLLGGGLVVCSLFVLVASPAAALILGLYGAALVYLMTTPGAEQDLGPWFEHVRQPAPWGSRPGTGLWSSEPAQQGPWAPDPRTLPWFSWKNHSGPRAPWWQTWQAGLRQGIPLWELVLLVLAFVVLAVGLVMIPFAIGGSHFFGTLHVKDNGAARYLLLIPAAIGVVAWLEQRMRRRLAGRG